MAEEWTEARVEARIRVEALRQGVDPNLAVAVAKQESNLRPDNPGDGGRSRGVFHMQRAAAIDAGIDPERRDDPETGIIGGIRYLKQRLDMSKGDVPQALSRYNRGTPDYRGIGDPDYVYHVMRHYPGSPLGKAPTDPEGYRARLNRTFGRGTAGEDEPRAMMASQQATEKPWWDKFVPRFGPRSAEAAAPAKKWYDDLVPDKEPTAATPPPQPPVAQPAATPQATTGQGKWYDAVPEKEPASPPAAPTGAPAQAPLPGAPPGQAEAPAPVQEVLPPTQEGAKKPPLISWRFKEPENPRWWEKTYLGIPALEIGWNRDVNEPVPSPPAGPPAATPGTPEPGPLPGEPSMPDVAPAPQQEATPAPYARPQRAPSPEEWFAQQAAPQTQAVTERIQPLASEGVSQALAETSVPAGFHLIGPDGRQHPQSAEIAATLARQGTPLSGTFYVRADAPPEALAQNPASAISPTPSTRTTVSRGLETGADIATGTAAAIGGGALAGVPGALAGPVLAQGALDRTRTQLGLRPQEDYLATGFGVSLYPSDVLNASVGLLTGGPALFKSALAKTSAGKAIVSAEMSTKEAYQAWQAQRKVLQEAQQTGQQAKVNIALKDHATAEANYKRLAQQRNETIAANKAEYDQAVTDYQTTANQAYVKDVGAKQQYLDDLAERQRKQYGTVRAETERELLASREAGYTKTLDQIKREQAKYETKVGAEERMWESQAAAIPEAQAIPKPYEAGTPYHVLYTEMRNKYSDAPLTLDAGKAALTDLRANRPKTLAGTPSPFEGEVETIAQGLEKATGANVATIHEELKKLGPLTRHGDGKIRGDAKQVAGILMDVLETNPDAAGAIKVANMAFKRQTSLEDMNDWLKPEHGVISSRRGKTIIHPDNFLKKFNREMEDSKFFRDSFTPEEAATIRGNMEALAAKTLPAPPLRAPTSPTPELLPGASPPPPVTGEALPAGAYPERFTKGLAGAPERTPLPPPPELATPPKEVPPLYPEFPKSPWNREPSGLTVPLEPPAKIPPEPASTTVWPRGQIPPPKNAWTSEQWTAYAEQELAKKPGLGKQLMGAAAGAGGMAFALQRMGVPIATVNGAMFTAAGLAAGTAAGRYGDWMLSRALLSDRYRPLLQQAIQEGNTLNPYFYNAMLAGLTPEDRRDYERMKRSREPQKARP